MSGNPFYQNLDPMAVPDAITPQAGPGDPAGYGMVTPHGQGTAPYDIQADLGAIEADITTRVNASGSVSGAGIVYPQGARQREAMGLLDSPQGFNSGGGLSGYDIPSGWSGEPDESWANVAGQPTTVLETPVQGQMGTYPSATSTAQEGLRKYGTD